MKKFPFYRQYDRTDCGPTCLRMIAKHYGKIYPVDYLREKCNITRDGVSLMGIAEAAEDIGMHSLAANVKYDTLQKEAPLPCIAYWRQRHFVVVYEIDDKIVHVADPEHGKIKYSKEDFLTGWTGLESRSKGLSDEGLLLLLEPTPAFYERDNYQKKSSHGLKLILPYFRPFKSYIVQLLLGLLMGSILQFIFPFLTQSIVDYGIRYQNLSFIQLILAGQIIVFLSQLSISVIRN